MSDNESEENDIDIIRRNNLEEKNAFLAKFMNDPLFANAIKEINLTPDEKSKNSAKAFNKRKRTDGTFRFTGAIPNDRRSSARLRHKKPDFTYYDLPDEKQIVADSDSLDDLEEVVYTVKRSRKPSPRSVSLPIIPVEEITEDMISKIQRSGNKVYGPGGTSCHQCRQKTVDTKTVCRSGYCVGIRGQFCGICVINRYGEDPAEALKDPNWQCYVCRGCCNCSFCRAKQGKRPTGILAPLAKMNGFKSVREFLSSLKGYGDYAEPEKNSENLLGFNGNVAVMGGNKRKHLICHSGCAEPEKNSENLLGFDGIVAVMSGNIKKHLTCYGGCEQPEKNSEDLLGFCRNVAVMSGNKKIHLTCDYDAV